MNEYDNVDKNFETLKIYKQTLEDTLTNLFLLLERHYRVFRNYWSFNMQIYTHLWYV